MIAGLYTIELYNVISEEWISHTIDEMIPCKKMSDGSYRSVVADPNGEEIWVPLLEKAMAKHFGGYSGIGKGSKLSIFVCVLVCMYVCMHACQ
jgi:calpain-15